MACELPAIKDRVRQSAAWTAEGQRARERLQIIFRSLQLAAKSGNREMQEGVRLLIGTYKADLPNLGDGGSIN